jgi:hypothetical protein
MVLISTVNHFIDLGHESSTIWGIEKGAGEIRNMLRYASAKKKHGEIVGEVIAIIGPEIVSLLALAFLNICGVLERSLHLWYMFPS